MWLLKAVVGFGKFTVKEISFGTGNACIYKEKRIVAQCVLCSVRCPCIFYDPVYDTIRRRGGYRGIFREEGVDTGAYFRGNHGYRV